MTFPLVAFRMRWMSASAVTGLLAIAMLVALSARTAPELPLASALGAAEHGKVGSSLASMAVNQPAMRTEVIVRMEQDVDPSVGRGLVQSYGGSPVSGDLEIINGFGASMSARDAARLAEDPRVRAVSENGGVRSKTILPETGDATSFVCPPADATATTQSWPLASGDDASIRSSLSRLDGAAHHSLEVDEAWEHGTGRGVGVAVIDTGIAGDMPDFRYSKDSRSSRVRASAVTNPCATSSRDNYGHGTHMAGLIAGNSLMQSSSKPDYGRYMGIAPSANLISVKVGDEDGATTVLDVIHGLQFVVDNRDEDDLDIRVVNLSLSSTVAESYRTDPLDAAAEQAWNNGIVVVAAAGNEGTADDAVSYAPGNDPYVITVGAVDDQGTRNVDDDKLAAWSSHGVTQDGFRKPEVLAPGAHLVSTLAIGSDFQQLCPDCKVGDHYFQAGGTSMAAALVSGVAALVIEDHPSWTPNEVKYALQNTLRNVPGVGGEVDAHKAMHSSRRSANAGLVPNQLIDGETGDIDYTRASFRRASFRDASDSNLLASWSRASFRCDCGMLASGDIDPTRASFRRASFRKTIGFNK